MNEQGKRDVKDIHVREYTPTRKWCATCKGPDGDELAQWGKTADLAAYNLRAFAVNIKGYTWPEVERQET